MKRGPDLVYRSVATSRRYVLDNPDAFTGVFCELQLADHEGQDFVRIRSGRGLKRTRYWWATYWKVSLS